MPYGLLPDQGIPGQPSNEEVQYVLDGGALLQRIPWGKGATFKQICSVYTEYVTRKYGNAIVVFDGYQGKSTKDMTQKMRIKGQTGVPVTFTENMHLTMKRLSYLETRKTSNDSSICSLQDCWRRSARHIMLQEMLIH